MDQTHATYEELRRLLPRLEELEELRLSLIGAAEPDPTRAWDRASAFSTFDKRVVRWDRMEGILAEAEASAHEHVASVFAGVRALLDGARAGRDAEGARELVALGEHFEQIGRFEEARRCMDAALALSLPLADKEPQVLALRRIGRVALAQGDLTEALAYYQRSAEVAADAGAARGEVIARTGAGNVRSTQGWWSEAERWYRAALERLDAADEELSLERAQLCNNLGLIATQRGDLPAARAWLEEAEGLWTTLSSPDDLAICYHNQARLLEREGAAGEGNRLRERALALATYANVRAGIAIDLAESCVREGDVNAAERWGRAAEQHAIAARSPYLLGRIYQGLGNIARERGEDDGFVFYEKALEIARERSLSFLEAETSIDYALLRGRNHEHDEARAYLQRALEILDELGAVHERARAERALRELAAPREVVVE